MSIKNSISSSTRNSNSKIPIKLRNANIDLTPPQSKKFSLRKQKTYLSIARSTDCNLNNIPLSEFNTSRIQTNGTHQTGIKHRTGEIPSYLKKIDHGGGHIDRKFETMKKAYKMLKEKVGITQAAFMQSHKALKEFIQNHEDAEHSMPLEDINLVTLVMNDNQEILIRKDDGTLEAIAIFAESPNQDSSKFDKIREKLNSTGETASSLCKDILNYFTKFPSESGDEVISEGNLKEIKTAMKDTVHTLEDKMYIFSDTVKELESFLSSFVVNLKYTKDAEKKSGEDEHNCLDNEEFVKMKSRFDELIEENEKLQKKVKYLADGIEEKDNVKKKLEMEIEQWKADGTTESLKEELEKLQSLISEYQASEEEATKKFEEEHDKCLQLDEELANYNEIIEELKEELNNQKSSPKPQELQAEIQSLREKLNKACEEKSLIEKERDAFKQSLDNDKVVQLTADFENARKEIFSLTATQNSLKENILQLERANVEKQNRINYLEDKHSQIEAAEVQEEKRNMNQIDLKKELSDANAKLVAQNEIIEQNERLLHVRGETISKLEKSREEDNKRFIELEKVIEMQNEEVNKATELLDSHKSEMKNLMFNLGLKESQLGSVQEVLEKLKQHNEMLQCVRTECEKNIHKLKSDNVKLKEMMSALNLR